MPPLPEQLTVIRPHGEEAISGSAGETWAGVLPADRTPAADSSTSAGARRRQRAKTAANSNEASAARDRLAARGASPPLPAVASDPAPYLRLCASSRPAASRRFPLPPRSFGGPGLSRETVTGEALIFGIRRGRGRNATRSIPTRSRRPPGAFPRASTISTDAGRRGVPPRHAGLRRAGARGPELPGGRRPLRDRVFAGDRARRAAGDRRGGRHHPGPGAGASVGTSSAATP